MGNGQHVVCVQYKGSGEHKECAQHTGSAPTGVCSPGAQQVLLLLLLLLLLINQVHRGADKYYLSEILGPQVF